MLSSHQWGAMQSPPMSGIKDKGHFDPACPQPRLGSNIPLLQNEIVLSNYFILCVPLCNSEIILFLTQGAL